MLHASSRTAKIAGAAALAGLMMTVAIIAATHKPEPAPALPAVRGDQRHDRLASELDRCATLTMPDSGCEAAWAENRRRFFHQPVPDAADGSSAVPSENTAP